MRCALYATIREYAQDRLVAAGEHRAAQRAHAAYFLRLAEAMAAQADVTAGHVHLDALNAQP